jgi:hypothetical protein
MRKVEMIGQKFHRLTCLQESKSDRHGMYYVFQCDCGNTLEKLGATVRVGRIKSCGCGRGDEIAKSNKRRATHAMTNTPTYNSWKGMRDRCKNPNIPDYENYGAKGVTVCEKWDNSFEAFLADMGERPDGMTLDRINPFGNYEPDNCRWADYHTQRINRRSNHVDVSWPCN